MIKRTISGTLSALALTVISTSAVAAGATNARVMTRNLYVGADLFAGIAVPPAQIPDAAGDVLAEIVASDFPARAKVLADEIARAQPHAVGLQEVWNVSGTPYASGAPIQIDFLALLTSELAARGQKYTVAIANTNVQLTLPVNLPVAPGVRLPYAATIQDRDVILVRHNVAWSNAAAGHYAVVLPVDLNGDTVTDLQVLRGWTSVDVVFGGNAYRVVNTHLEVESFADGFFQTAQAFELRGALGQLDAVFGALPEVVVGDFNSDEDDPPCVHSLCVAFGIDGFTPYLVLSNPLLGLVNPAFGTALTDVWNLRNNDRRAAGDTCCYVSLAQDDAAGVDRRVDQVWLRGAEAVGVTVHLSGDDPKRQTPGGLYGSDHLGVAARMTLMPGQ